MDIDLKAGAKMLLADRVLNSVLEDMEANYIDRFVLGEDADDRLRQDMATSLRVVRNLRSTLEALAGSEEQAEGATVNIV